MIELRLREILAKRGITLKDFAAQSGLSQSNLSNYINGKISPTLDTVSRIASHLDIDAIELFKEKDEVELYAKYHGKLYPITNEDLISIIQRRNELLIAHII